MAIVYQNSSARNVVATLNMFFGIGALFSVLLLISSLNMSPVDTWKLFNLSTKILDWVPLPAPGGPKIIIFTSYLPNLVFLIKLSYWELINLVCICVTVSIATTTTINIEAPPK